MLVKAHSNQFMEDFGILDSKKTAVDFLENGPVPYSRRLRLSPVLRVNAMWMRKEIKVRCAIAATPEERTRGLQGYTRLAENEGMYFPYPGGSRVAFHQGSVPFPLDLLFVLENRVIQVEEMTRVGSGDRWVCEDCDGVIEVNGGFVREQGVNLADEVVLLAVSERDLQELEVERHLVGILSDEV